MPEKILTDLAVRRLRLPEGRREQLLGDGANLFLRLRPQSRDWLFVWKDQGKKHKLMLGSASDLSLAEAREKAREARAHLADGKHPRVERQKRRVEQILWIQRREHSRRRSTRCSRRGSKRRSKSNTPTVEKRFVDVMRRMSHHSSDSARPTPLWKPTLSKCLMLSPGEVQTASPDRCLPTCVKCSNSPCAVDSLSSIPTDDLSKKEWNGESVERDRVLSELEILQLRDQVPKAKLIPETECAIWIMLGTGCRVGELSRSRWDWIVGDELMLPKEITKTKEPHTVVLSPFVRRHLKRLRAANPKSEWLFPAKHNGGAVDEKSITKQFTDRQRGKPIKGRSPAVTSLRLPGGKWNSHDFRRTAATLMQTKEVGALPHVIEAVLNDAEPNRMKRIYQHHKYRDEMRDAWLRLGAQLDKLLRK